MNLLENLANIFGAARYQAHSICLTNDAFIINIFILSDGGIGLAYYLIAGVLYYSYLNKARVIRLVLIILNDHSFLKLFFLFIMCCGFTHHTMLLTLWYGVYYLDAFARFVTFVVSFGTAIRVALVIWKASRASIELDALSGEIAPPYEGRPLPLPNKAADRQQARSREATRALD